MTAFVATTKARAGRVAKQIGQAAKSVLATRCGCAHEDEHRSAALHVFSAERVFFRREVLCARRNRPAERVRYAARRVGAPRSNAFGGTPKWAENAVVKLL